MLYKKTVENPVIESDTTGWTKIFNIDLIFASGIEDVEAARTKVYNGFHDAEFRVTTNDY